MRWYKLIGYFFCAVLLAPAALGAAGYAVPEQSAKASGMAGAWVARADDSAANWYNPAALVWLEKSEVQFGSNFLFVGDMELRQTARLVPESVNGIPVLYDEPVPATYGLGDSLETPFHLYVAQPVNDRVAWGVGLTTPFGLVSEWSDPRVTKSAATSELLTLMLNGNVAVRVGAGWSVAVGLDYVRAELTEFSADVFTLVPVITPEGPVLAVVDLGSRDLTGDGDDWSWNVALHRRGDPWSFGLTYRAELTPSIEGDLVFTSDLLPDTPARGELSLPARGAAGVAWDRGGDWTFELDLEWTDWSSFDALQIDLANPLVPDIELRQDWDDTMSYRFGASRRWPGGHEGRAGVLVDPSPGPPETLRPSIPDTDRWALTVGYGFERAKWALDGYYMALFFDEATARPGEPGVIGGEYEGFGNVLGVTLRRRL